MLVQSLKPNFVQLRIVEFVSLHDVNSRDVIAKGRTIEREIQRAIYRERDTQTKRKGGGIGDKRSYDFDNILLLLRGDNNNNNNYQDLL